MKSKTGKKSSPANGLKVVSLFTGAGGLDLGFEQAGFETVYAGDFDAMCCETLQLNRGKYFPNHMEVIQADIRKINLNTLPKDVDLVVGGPPCQAFSASGRRAGGAPGRLDDRGTLFEGYRRVIQKLKPKAFLFENVRGILATNQGEDWKAIVSSFEKIGYKISFRILDALDYGAPQQRERMIMVGHTMSSTFLFPEPIFGPDSKSGKKHITAGEALRGLKDTEPLAPLVLSGGKYGHLLKLVPPGDNYLYFTAKRGYPTPIFAYRSRFSDFLYKANPDTSIKTLIASPGKYTGPFHWENRRFTVAEYKRLQGFPDDYKFAGSRADIIKQIGNSVSPKFSYCLALALAKQVFGKKVDVSLMSEDKILSFDKRKGQKAQKTRTLHEEVSNKRLKQGINNFKFKNYETYTAPSTLTPNKPNTSITANSQKVKIVIRADVSKKIFARMKFSIALNKNFDCPDALVEAVVYGGSPSAIQTMWNAIDNWVINSSSFHSLFELYGHFTEPHPIFHVSEFTASSSHPVALFAQHCSNFLNCSTHFSRDHLTNLFGITYNKDNFIELVEMLRGYRFDIRCIETNVTMPKDKYMVCYPFTLPHAKQMNFSVKRRDKDSKEDRHLYAAE